MHRSKPTARVARLLDRSLASLACILALLLVPTGCDNPACIFSGDCSGGDSPGAGLGSNPASVPKDGEQIRPGAPTVTSVFPSGPGADTRTPIVVVFSEAMSPTNLNIAFELVATGGASGALPFASARIGDGRVLVLFPNTPLQPSVSYALRYRANVNFQDVTGIALTPPAEAIAGTFSTLAQPTAAPRVVAIWPPDAGVQQSPSAEIVVAFDRPMLASSFGDSSFVVTVDGDPPTFAHDLQSIPPGVTSPQSETRVWRYRSLDSEGEPGPLGIGAEIGLTLSPAGQPLVDTLNTSLATTSAEFTTQAFSAPTAAAITSSPSDAIGIDQISGPANLAVRVDFVDAADGDVLEIYLFGTKQNAGEQPPLAALFREVPLEDPFTTFTLTADEIDLVAGGDNVFADGPLAFAFQVRRGTQRSPVTVLDVDPDESGVQLPLLDTVAPVLLGLSPSGKAVSTFRSDVRDVVLVGRASELLRAALVDTPLGANTATPAVPPPVAGSAVGSPPVPDEDQTFLFVAAPVEIGIVPPASLPLAYSLTIYDRALNSAPTVNGTLRQLGASGPGASPTGATIAVDVFDASTLEAIEDATVTTHRNVGGTVEFVATTTTDAAGHAVIAAADAGETILTVDGTALDYGLFTFDGVPTNRLGVPLQPNALADGTTSGLVASTNEDVLFYTRTVSDSRSKESASKLFPVGLCTFDQEQARYECPFSAFSIRAGQIGAQSALAVAVPASPFEYSAVSFLRAFELEMPVPPAVSGIAATNTISFPFLLDDGGLDAEERAVDVPAHQLSTAAYPSLAGAPIVTVESTSPGVRGAVVVGRGVAFADPVLPDVFGVRAAYPGAVDGIQDVVGDLLGRLVTSQTVDGDLRVRAEVSDAAGNQAGARPRLSQTTLVLAPPASSTLDAVPAVLNPGGESFDLVFGDVLPDAAGMPGLYRVVINDVDGLRWTFWRADRADADGPNAIVHVPFVGPGTTLPLAPGILRAQVSLFAWPDLDPAELLWTDVEREHDLYSHAPRVPFTPP